jgi:hypothetical protein
VRGPAPRRRRPEGEREREQESFRRMVRNLCHMAASHRVPHVLLLGLSYMGSDEEELPLGSIAAIDLVRETEDAAREIMSSEESTTALTIARVSDMSEIGFLLELALKTGVWPCAWGRDPLLRPITSRDFGVAVASFVEKARGTDDPVSRPEGPAELLVGGPQSIRWRELGTEISRVTGTPLRTVGLPLWVYRAAIAACRIGAARGSARLERAASLLVMVGIPMLVDTTSEDHEAFGDDSIDDSIARYCPPKLHIE